MIKLKKLNYLLILICGFTLNVFNMIYFCKNLRDSRMQFKVTILFNIL